MAAVAVLPAPTIVEFDPFLAAIECYKDAVQRYGEALYAHEECDAVDEAEEVLRVILQRTRMRRCH